MIHARLSRGGEVRLQWSVEISGSVNQKIEPAPGTLSDADAASLPFDQGLADIEAQAKPAHRCRRIRSGDAVKLVEEIREVLVSDADPFVSYGDAHICPILFEPYPDGGTRLGVRKRVGEQIRQHLFESCGVGSDKSRHAIRVKQDDSARGKATCLDDTGTNRAQIAGLWRQCEGATTEAGDISQIGDERLDVFNCTLQAR